ncbi:hypothetical protein EU546_06530, partial [Candidatus Thorarchaeota archaeon]
MEEYNKVLEALSVVEGYDEYLFRRAWGKALIVIGAALPLGVIVSLNALVVATATGLEASLVSLLANVMTVIVAWGYVAYVFLSNWRTAEKKGEEESSPFHGPLIGITWFVVFILASMAPESLQVVALLWAASASCILTFIILRVTGGHSQGRVILYLGMVLGITSFPLLLITSPVLLAYVALAAFSACFIL